MSATALPEHSPGSDGDSVPFWSGIPVFIGSLLALVALHVSDGRQVRMPPAWRHVTHWTNDGGDVEFHLYRRAA